MTLKSKYKGQNFRARRWCPKENLFPNLCSLRGYPPRGGVMVWNGLDLWWCGKARYGCDIDAGVLRILWRGCDGAPTDLKVVAVVATSSCKPALRTTTTESWFSLILISLDNRLKILNLNLWRVSKLNSTHHKKNLKVIWEKTISSKIAVWS